MEKEQITKEEELRQLLLEAKSCIDHARSWIKNIKEDFQDNGTYKLISEKIGKILDEKEGEIRFKPAINETYYYLTRPGRVAFNQWADTNEDYYLYNTHNCFKTDNKTIEYGKWKLIKSKLINIAMELGIPTENDWKNKNKTKYVILFNYSAGEICYSCYNAYKYDTIYCLEGEKYIEKAIEEIGKEDLEWYLQQTKFM